MLLHFFVDGDGAGKQFTWITASLHTVQAWEEGPHHARRLREWTRDFLKDRHHLPHTTAASWKTSVLEKPGLKEAICQHLQSVGKYVRAMDIVEFMADPEVQAKYGLEKTIGLSTAQEWMHELDYRWTKAPSGQYVDGHECSDVVDYRDNTFLLAMAKLEQYTQCFIDGEIVLFPDSESATSDSKRVVFWYHNESTFYAHDRRHTRWVHKSERATPRAKGEGASLMVADFVSAEYSFFRSPDGTESAWVLFRAGKNQDGYFTNQEIVDHATLAMDILERHYPNERHILIFDNATTHLKRRDDALSAHRMSANPTAPGKPMFGVDIDDLGPDGRPIYRPDGKKRKKRVRMGDAKFADGRPQSLYFEEGTERPGVFKGMRQILAERDIDTAGKLAQCPDFKCKAPALTCCVRRILYNKPDFRDTESILESHCNQRGFEVLFLPKFHCELNPIEQCWGHAKREYRKFPASSLEADLERNTITSLDSVSLTSIRRFFIRSLRFMDAYRHGLSGKQAAWAAKTYHGHQVLPNNILDELEKAGVSRE
ncbi:hypothetical protein DAEQUDRAFT_674282 [Daedalea quercina L-15889]|uniref:Tc1-like transposase DDE domain-containing protein n=1 Tax=Daedalea quercina L-15889 TaxID=1314783 RepID=A0A165NCY2_9APHY|nr:hypothetical protein DAEQUDRAFT_674282 [Daedalea quercina L-15889]